MTAGPQTIDRRTLVCGVAAAVLPLPLFSSPSDAASPDGIVTLEAREGTFRVQPPPAGETAIWGYGGVVPGPVLRIRKGDEIKVRLVNALAQPTSLTWHGVRTVNAMDGVGGLTQQPVGAGGTFDYRFTPPDSGFYWYHSHVWPHAAEQIGRGLYGMLIVEEPSPPVVDKEILVVLDDWLLDAKGQIEAVPAGRIGSLVTVNSKPGPAIEAARPGARVRLRLLNVCAVRITVLAVEGAVPTVIAIDGQPSEIFQPAHGTVPIGPGARFEMMLDCPRTAGQAVALILRGDGEPDRALLTIKTVGTPVPDHPPVAKLAENPLLPTRIPLERSARHEIVIGQAGAAPAAAGKPSWLWTINGAGSDGVSGKPLFAVKRGSVVTLTLVNKTNVPQQMHIHGHVWRLLHDLDDGWDPYWRESVLLAPGKTKHVAFVADNPGKWALASSIPDRQDTGLATWFHVN